jgi:hypothetical protein
VVYWHGTMDDRGWLCSWVGKQTVQLSKWNNTHSKLHSNKCFFLYFLPKTVSVFCITVWSCFLRTEEQHASTAWFYHWHGSLLCLVSLCLSVSKKWHIVCLWLMEFYLAFPQWIYPCIVHLFCCQLSYLLLMLYLGLQLGHVTGIPRMVWPTTYVFYILI